MGINYTPSQGLTVDYTRGAGDEDTWKNLALLDPSYPTQTGAQLSPTGQYTVPQVPTAYDISGVSKYGNIAKQSNPLSSLGLNIGTLEAGGSLLGGIGKLAQGWAAIKSLGVAEDQLEENKRQYDQNYASQRTTINNRIADQNAWKAAQGRTDLANLVV